MSQSPHGLIFLKPVFHEKIWGGRKLADDWGYQIPDGPIGECWAISAHPNGDCAVDGGTYDGMLLSEVWRDHREVFGAVPDGRGGEAGEFPLLVKILDAADDLSVQVHPDDEYAAAHEGGSLGKKECWYVLDCDQDGTIVVGQRAAGADEFRQLVEEGRWSELLNEVPVHKGDFFQINPGTVHAIKGGTVILETQQSSDVTYRVYDYDRMQDDGTARPLHLEQSMECVDFNAKAPESGKVTTPVIDGIQHLADTDRYIVDLVSFDGEKTFSAIPTFRCVSVIEGEGKAEGRPVRRGDHFIVPAAYGDATLTGRMKLIVSRVPTAL
ncbi:type I phosphomannose isomerase catalytic subunit [Paratractidigestivibacter sp.]|uniref:type I phosphomannose isomerase catalytic subunit n=1 Tax=Paratractidigestivibacter sp. TaxID=2847316 RepID=UPI002AC9AE3E|nr:type I phosphomannose isomerase catalytic subunit [Paratractidigestivibacter sp.]